MATIITSECINCGACEPECPNQAIYQGGAEWELDGQKHPALSQQYFYIVPDKCTECVGFHEYEACAAVCPVDCCVPDPDVQETEEQLLARARKLHPDLQVAADFPSRFRPGAASPASIKKQETRAPVLAPARPVIAAAQPTPAEQPAASPPEALGEPSALAPGSVEAAAAGAAEPEAALPGPQAPAEAAGEKRFDRELGLDFAQAMAALQAPSRVPEGRHGWLAAWRGRGKPVLREGKVGQDGFRNAQFDAKLERERRYGEVYRLREESNGFFLELEFPRRVPPSAIKEQLGVPDEMPEYDYDLQLQGASFVVRGRVSDEKMRKIAAVSPAFPPDFLTRIQLPAAVAGFRHRVRDRTLEVALVKEA